MKFLLFFCSMTFLLLPALAQSRTFKYDPWLTNIYTGNEVTGFVEQDRDLKANPNTAAGASLIVMDDQLQVIARKEIKAQAISFRVYSAARYGNMVAIVYAAEESGTVTSFLPVNAVQVDPVDYRMHASADDYKVYHDEPEIVTISGVGFACYYGMKHSGKVTIFDSTGHVIKTVTFPYQTENIKLLVHKHDIFFQSDHLIAHYSLDSGYFMKEAPLDGLKVLDFDLDPVTGNPYVSGTILHPKRKNKKIAAGRYSGFFTMDYDTGWHRTTTDWKNDTIVPMEPKRGVRDESGRTVFAGGYISDREFGDPFIMEMDSTGSIVYRGSFPTSHHGLSTMNPSLRDGHQSFRTVILNGKIYLLVTDLENFHLYSPGERKVVFRESNKNLRIMLVGRTKMITREVYEEGRRTIYTVQPIEKLIHSKD